MQLHLTDLSLLEDFIDVREEWSLTQPAFLCLH